MSRRAKKKAVKTTSYPASQELYQALFEQATDGIFIADRQGHCVEVNRHGCEMLGYTREELLGLSMEDLIPAEDLAGDPLQLDALRVDKTLLKERRMRCKDGRLLPVEISAQMLTDGRFLGIVRDISERRNVEEQLRESNERFRLLAESSLTGIYLIQEDRFRYVNPAMAHIFGYEVEEVTDKLGPLDLVYSDDRPLVVENIRRRIEGEVEAVHYDFRGLRKDGSVIYIEVHGRRIEYGGKEGVIGTLVDITERKRAEELLRKREQEFRALAENSPDVIARFDREGRYLYVNSALEKITNIPVQEFPDQRIGERLSEHMAPAVPEEVLALRQTIKQVFTTGVAFETETKVMLPDGEHIFNVRLIPENDEVGQVISVLHLARDITEQKRAEQELQRSNDLLRAIIEAAPTAIIGLDLDGNVQMVWNPAAEKMLGWSAQEAIGRPLPSVPVENQAEFARFREWIRSGKTMDGVEVHRQRRDGSPIDYSIYASPLHDAEGQITGNIAVLVDITERKRAEQSIALMNFALDNVHEAAFLIDEKARLHYVNEEVCRVLGYIRDELLGLSVADVDPDFPMERWSSHWDDLKTHRSLIFESRHKTKNGRLIPVEISANYFEYDGQSYNLALVRDITERKRLEEDHQTHLWFLESMDQVNRAIQGTNDLEQMMRDVLDILLSIFDCDRAWLVYPCNPEAATWQTPMERTRPEYPGVLSVGIELPLDPVGAEVFRILRAASGPVQFGLGAEHPVPAVMTQVFSVQSFIAMALYPKVGQPWSFGLHQCSYSRVWTREDQRLFQEIGRRLADGLTGLLAYRNLQESEERYRLIAENTADTIRIFDLNLNPIYVSPSVLKLRGYTVAEAMTQSLGQVLTPESLQRANKVLGEHMALEASGTADPGRTVLLELEEYRKDGSTIWVELAASILRDNHLKPTGILTVTRDITERKRAEEEFRQLNQKLEQRVAKRTAQLEAANNELEAFAYSVSHDLRAPLRHIDGFLELLQKRLTGTLDERSQHYMGTISDSAKRMGQLIDDLLAFSRMGRYELSKEPVDLSALVQDIIRELEPETQGRAIDWRIADLPTVTGDRAMLRQALVNLLANAIKFTREGPQVEIEIGCQAGEKETVIFIRDNGVGFDMAYADKLFGVFQRLHHADEFEGTGIGLANVRRIINRHGGRTWAEGKVDQGAAFYFSLPSLNQGVN